MTPENAEILKRLKKIEKNVNLFDGELEVGLIDPSSGSAVANANCIRSKNFQSIYPNTEYQISIDMGYHLYIHEYDNDFNHIKQAVSNAAGVFNFKTSSNARYIKFRTATANKEKNTNARIKLLEL